MLTPKRTACAEAVEANAALARHIIPERSRSRRDLGGGSEKALIKFQRIVRTKLLSSPSSLRLHARNLAQRYAA